MALKKRKALRPLEPVAQTQEGGTQHYPLIIAARYKRELMPLIRRMEKEYREQMTAFALQAEEGIAMDSANQNTLNSIQRKLREKFERLFAKEAPRIAEGVIGQMNDASKVSTALSLKDLSAQLTIQTPPGLSKMVTGAIRENVALIKSIPIKYHEQIQKAVAKSMEPGGEGLKTITDNLLKYEGVTRRRAEFIALDQTRKVTANLNAERTKAAGVKKFVWIHSGGGAHPRELHKYFLNGQTFSYDDLPIIDERTGEKGLPGTLPNCRCTAKPIVDFDDF